MVVGWLEEPNLISLFQLQVTVIYTVYLGQGFENYRFSSAALVFIHVHVHFHGPTSAAPYSLRAILRIFSCCFHMDYKASRGFVADFVQPGSLHRVYKVPNAPSEALR